MSGHSSDGANIFCAKELEGIIVRPSQLYYNVRSKESTKKTNKVCITQGRDKGKEFDVKI